MAELGTGSAGLFSSMSCQRIAPENLLDNMLIMAYISQQ
jgi:hypothetical protein